jgi:2-succinyl-5-enolpyruvyl-6-hydroxy-3-cyclohexene-1-carboxylate synthase
MVTVSSSMPVRDLEWFAGRSAVAHSNRGANGIDGVISTAVGRALAGNQSGTNVVLIGDLAFVHDANSLVALSTRGIDLRIIVVDNDGGGIFSFLPQAGELSPERFEQLFGTPLGTDVLALASAHGIATTTASTRSELIAQMHCVGPWVCRVPSNRAANVDEHARLNAAVAEAIAQR